MYFKLGAIKIANVYTLCLCDNFWWDPCNLKPSYLMLPLNLITPVLSKAYYKYEGFVTFIWRLNDLRGARNPLLILILTTAPPR